MRSRGGQGRGRFGLSSGDLPSSSGSAGKTVIVDCVNVFLDLDAIVLGTAREVEISRHGCHPERRDRWFPRVAHERD